MKEERKYAVKFGINMSIEIVECEKGCSMLNFCYKQIDREMIEHVRICAYPPMNNKFCMIVDEEGLYSPNRYVNYLGSYLYGTQRHLQPIVRDVLILKEVPNDFVLLTYEEAQHVVELANAFRTGAYNMIHGKLVDAGVLVGR